MPANFFSVAWPLAFSVILMAGFIVSLAAVATLIAVIARARHLTGQKSSQAPEGKDDVSQSDQTPLGSSLHSEAWLNQESAFMETVTMSGIYIIPPSSARE